MTSQLLNTTPFVEFQIRDAATIKSAIAARYTPARQDSLVFNLSQFATAVAAKPPFELAVTEIEPTI
jgi:hypothetical protein